MNRNIENYRSRRRAIVIPCALGGVALLAVLCVMGASATAGGRRTLEVARSSRWVRLAAASAFDEAVARIIVLTARRGLPMPSGPTDTRDLAPELRWLEAVAIPTPVTGRAFRDESVEVGPVSFRTGAWVVQSSATGGQTKVREVALVTLEVAVTVRRPGHKTRKRVTVQRYATAVPAGPPPGAPPPGPPPGGPPPGVGVQIVVSPMDVFHQEDPL